MTERISVWRAGGVANSRGSRLTKRESTFASPVRASASRRRRSRVMSLACMKATLPLAPIGYPRESTPNDHREVMPPMSKLTTFVAGAGFGAGGMYLLDPRAGAERRVQARERAGQVAHSGPVQTVAHTAAAQAQTVKQTAGAQASGVVAKAKSAATGGDSAPGDDNTLKAKVETEIFRA